MKKSMNKVIKIGLGIAALVLLIGSIGMFYLASYLEDNIDELQQAVSAALGREVQFAQGVEFQWSLTPSIAIKGMRIGNPKWAKAEHLITAEHAVLQFALAGLLSQRLDISELTLEKADAIVEYSKEGKHNWQFDDDESSDASVLPESIHINDSRLRYFTEAGKEHLITIDHFEIEGLADRAIDVEAKIQYDKRPISISMESDSRVVIETHGKQAKPFRVATRIKKDDRFLELKDIEIRADKSVLTGEARLPISAGKGLVFNLSADALDITPYLVDDEPGDDGKSPMMDYELKPESVKNLSGQLRVQIKQFKAGEVVLDDLLLDAKIDAGQMLLTVKDNAGKIDTHLEVKPVASAWQVNFAQKSELDIGELIEAGSDQASRTQAQAALNINLSGSGKSFKGVLGTSLGNINVKIGAGRLSDAMAELLPMGDVVESMLTTVGTQGGGKDHSRLECAVLAMDVKEGVARSRNGLAIRTPEVNVLGDGSVNLATGQIEFYFKTARRKGIGISVTGVAENFVHLTGTLDAPKVEVNAAGVLVHGGGALATGGVSLLYDSLAKRLTSESNPCEIVEKSAKKQAVAE